MSEVKQDRRQVCLNDEGRSALLAALRNRFPRYPAGVYPDNWQEATKVDRRTVDKMLAPGQRLRQASIDSIFKDLGASFDEEAYLDHSSALVTQAAPSESVDERNGIYEQEPDSDDKELPGVHELSTSMTLQSSAFRRPQGSSWLRRYGARWAALAVAVVASGLAYGHFHKPATSAPANSQSDSSGSSEPAEEGGGMVLYDQFKADTMLRSDLWTVNGSASRAALSKFESPAYALVIPKITMDKENGLGFSGMSGNGQQGAIESVKSFVPPFTVTALCNATSLHGDALRLGIAQDDGKKGVSMGFGSVDGSSEATDSGSFFCTAPNTSGVLWQQVGAPLSQLPPAQDIWYVLTIVVDASGKATAAVSSGGFPIGTSTVAVGRGPFHVVLAQEDGTKGVAGTNQAYCGTIQVINEAEE